MLLLDHPYMSSLLRAHNTCSACSNIEATHVYATLSVQEGKILFFRLLSLSQTDELNTHL